MDNFTNSTAAAPQSEPRQAHEPACSVCTHPDRESIDHALLVDSVRAVADQFDLSKSAVQRHRANHLPAAMAQDQERSRRRVALAIPRLRERLEDLHADAAAIYSRAIGTENAVAVRAVAVMTRQIDMALRIAAAVPSAPELVPSGFELLPEAILGPLESHPDLRAAVAESVRKVEATLFSQTERH